jgi:hypothetical protein
MDEYTPCKKADPTAREAIGKADSGFRTVRMMSDRELAKHRARTRTWNANREAELRLAAEKKRNKMMRQNAELQLRANAIIRMGLKLKEFQRYLLVSYDGQVKDIERRAFERMSEDAVALFARYDQLIAQIVERNTEKER